MATSRMAAAPLMAAQTMVAPLMVARTRAVWLTEGRAMRARQTTSRGPAAPAAGAPRIRWRKTVGVMAGVPRVAAPPAAAPKLAIPVPAAQADPAGNPADPEVGKVPDPSADQPDPPEQAPVLVAPRHLRGRRSHRPATFRHRDARKTGPAAHSPWISGTTSLCEQQQDKYEVLHGTGVPSWPYRGVPSQVSLTSLASSAGSDQSPRRSPVRWLRSRLPTLSAGGG